MKRIIAGFSILCATFTLNAQTRFGLQGGVNLSRVAAKSGAVKATSNIKYGYVAGAVAEIDLGRLIQFRPELNFIRKGGKSTIRTPYYDLVTTRKSDIVLNYIQFLPNFVLHLNAGSKKLFVGVGPELSFGISGKSFDEINIAGSGTNYTTTLNRDVKFDGDKNPTDDKLHLKAFDLGLNTMIGYKISDPLFVSLSSTLGLLNISPKENSSFKNNSLNLKFGYFFGASNRIKK